MSVQTFYSLRELVDEARKISAEFDTVSFDLFDTLLIRRIHDPDLVKPSVARYISSLAKGLGISVSAPTVQKIRDRIEQDQRQETGQTFDDLEACYPVFMEGVLKEVFGLLYEEPLLTDVTGYELEMESRMLVPRRLLLEWIEELHRLKKRIFIISDIYLPAEHLRHLVARAGFLHLVEEVISSADTFLAKASGRAFSLVQERFGLHTKSWLHVGDNPISDGVRPAEIGIASLLIKDGEEKYRKAIIKRYFNYGKGRPFYRGRALQQLMLPLEGENVERPDLYIEGHNFIGPLIGAFVQHIAEQCRKLGLTKVYFFSREGYTFKKVWETIAPVLFPEGNLPEIEYLYVSRMALAGASCCHEGLTETSAQIALLPPGNKNFHDIARIFQLDLASLDSHLTRHKLSAESVLSPLHDGYEPKLRVRFGELLEDQEFQSEIKRQVRDSHEALVRYLEDADFFEHEQVAVVDIGWLGTIQRFLYNGVKHLSRCPRMHGYVFGATRGIRFDNDLKSSLEGVVYDRNRFDLGASCLLYARDLFEEACRAPHPTLERYELTDDGYRLKFRSKDDDTGKAEMEQDAFYSPLQQGIFDAAERYAGASALLGYSLEDYRPWFNYLLTAKLAFPKTREVLAVRHRHHLDDFHGAAKPRRKNMKGSKLLWDCGTTSLRFLPFIRMRYFWKHIRAVLKS